MRGEVVYQYAFDVANEIVTRDVRQVLGQTVATFEPRAAHSVPRDVPLYRALAVTLDRDLEVNGQATRVQVRVYEVGVVALSISASFDVPTLAELRELHVPRLPNAASLDDWARQVCVEVCGSLGEKLVHSSVPSEPEAYTVFCVAELGETDVSAWFESHRRDVAALVADMAAESLADQQMAESLRIMRCCTRRDLIVIDWDACLLVDLDGYFDDLLYVLELANVQLEEFRVMDRRLDRHLDRTYRDLEQAGRWRWRSPTAMLGWLRRFRVDVTKLADEVSHITKFFGDWYLARVYLGACERFHLGEWRTSVDRRLEELDEVYRVLQSDVYERRMLWLEVVVVVCFIVDLLAIFFWKR